MDTKEHSGHVYFAVHQPDRFEGFHGVESGRVQSVTTTKDESGTEHKTYQIQNERGRIRHVPHERIGKSYGEAKDLASNLTKQYTQNESLDESSSSYKLRTKANKASIYAYDHPSVETHTDAYEANKEAFLDNKDEWHMGAMDRHVRYLSDAAKKAHAEFKKSVGMNESTKQEQEMKIDEKKKFDDEDMSDVESARKKKQAEFARRTAQRQAPKRQMFEAFVEAILDDNVAEAKTIIEGLMAGVADSIIEEKKAEIAGTMLGLDEKCKFDDEDGSDVQAKRQNKQQDKMLRQAKKFAPKRQQAQG